MYWYYSFVLLYHVGMMRNTLLTLLMLGVALPAGSATQNSFYSGKEEGFFFYKDPREKEKKPEQAPPPPPPPEQAPPEPPKAEKKPEDVPFSVAWLRKNLEKLRDLAIDNPSNDNIANYLYANRVMLDKADTFSDKAMEVAQTDPFLDENNRVPIASAMNNWVMGNRLKAKDELLKHLSTKAGLWFFFDSKCKWCAAQYESVKKFGKQHNFLVRNISLDGRPLPGMDQWVPDQGQFKRIGLTLSPSVVVAVPPTTMLIVSQGMTSIQGLEERTLMAASAHKVLPADLRRDYDIYERGRLTDDDLNEKKLPDLDPNDPKAWVQYLRDALKGRY